MEYGYQPVFHHVPMGSNLNPATKKKKKNRKKKNSLSYSSTREIESGGDISKLYFLSVCM